MTNMLQQQGKRKDFYIICADNTVSSTIQN